MNDSLVPIAVALLCIVGIGLGAAALTDSLDEGGGGGGSPAVDNSSQEPRSGETAGDTPPATDNGSLGQGIQNTGNCLVGYDELSLFWILAAFSVGVSTIAAIRSGEAWTGIVMLPVVLISGTFLLAITMVVAGCSVPGGDTAAEVSQQNFSADNITDAVDGSEGDADDPTSRLQLGAILLAFVGALFLLAVYIQRRGRPVEEEPRMGEMTDSAEIATAAREAANRLEQVSDSENAVYRAWARMTEPLDVDHPESSTPGEFADAALAAGLDADDVDELTTLFETVRYGTTQITDEHERRAQGALRRIERSADTATDESPELSGDDPNSHESGGEQT